MSFVITLVALLAQEPSGLIVDAESALVVEQYIEANLATQQIESALNRDDVARGRIARVLQAGADRNFTRIDVTVLVLILVGERPNQPGVHGQTERIPRASCADRRVR